MNYELLTIKNNLTLHDLINFWFTNPKIWFNSTSDDDIFIKNMFAHLLTSSKIINNNPSNKIILAKIILYDQISRHIYRNNKENIKEYDILAYKYSLMILPVIDNFTPEERCFILMPLRHTFEQTNLEICLDYITNWMNNENNNISIYKRFYQATIAALVNVKNNNSTLYQDNIQIIQDHIYDINSSKLNISYIPDIINIKIHKLYKEFCKHVEHIKDNIIISLSGGVDSMVCSLLLYIYCINKKIKIYAVCINYTNRYDQYYEIEMIYKWTKILGIEFHVREINEIQRETCPDREFYEKITKNIRFSIYKKFKAPVILGHNKDDCIENIFSNITKKKNYNNLFGMSYQMIELDVEIIRPLLDISKSEIFQFAKQFNIPYTYDSTPKWSDRAKMRDILLPQINNFNPLILDGLIELSNNFKQIYSVYNNCIPNIIYENNKCIIENKNIFFFDYWKNIFNKISTHYNLPFIKNKSVKYFIDNINLGNKLTLSKYNIAHIYYDNIIIHISNTNNK